jgi:ubiquinone/menaquinone biosynthesis C-methylase UbiE
MLRRFIAANKRISKAITPRHVHEANVFGAYHKLAALLMAHPNVTTVVDVGAGKQWHFPKYYKEWFGLHLIGLDIDAAEMEPNEALDEKIRCNVVEDIPLADNSVDLFTVSSGIEHFSNNEQFLANAYRKLRPGGFFIAQFPSRYASFAIANRLLPSSVTRRILDNAMLDSKHELGFRAYYDRTHYSAFKKLVAKAGFRELYHLPGYYSSSYCEFFVPLYLVSYALDAVAFGMGVKQLAAYNLWVLVKPDPNSVEQPFKLYAWD